MGCFSGVALGISSAIDAKTPGTQCLAVRGESQTGATVISGESVGVHGDAGTLGKASPGTCAPAVGSARRASLSRRRASAVIASSRKEAGSEGSKEEY